MQCKDIPTQPILRMLADGRPNWHTWFDQSGGMPTVRAVMPQVDDKLALAKMQQLISKGLVSGCHCGCRGDFEITEKGLARLAKLEASA